MEPVRAFTSFWKTNDVFGGQCTDKTKLKAAYDNCMHEMGDLHNAIVKLGFLGEQRCGLIQQTGMI